MGVREDGLPGESLADLKLICGLCGEVWGEHRLSDKPELDGLCPDLSNPGTWQKTKFYWAGSVTLGQKPKSRECPCGIYRKDCEYHK